MILYASTERFLIAVPGNETVWANKRHDAEEGLR